LTRRRLARFWRLLRLNVGRPHQLEIVVLEESVESRDGHRHFSTPIFATAPTPTAMPCVYDLVVQLADGGAWCASCPASVLLFRVINKDEGAGGANNQL
jgi:hypothetical protein